MAKIAWKNAVNGIIVSASEFEFETCTGFEPGQGYLYLGASEFQLLEGRGEVALTTEFPDAKAPTSLTIKDLFITDYTKKTDTSGNTIYTAKLKDRRALWKKFGEVTLNANCQLPDGNLDPATLKNGIQYAWRELVSLCINAMGESPNALNLAALPENPIVPRNVRWAGRNAAKSLRDILTPAGYTIALHYNGKIEVIKTGTPSFCSMPAGYGPVHKTGKLFNLTPAAVQVVGTQIVNETEKELEPCALDTDGRVKGLENVSYLQGLDIGRELATDFASLTSEPEAQAAARLSVGRYFRIPGTGLYSDENGNANRGFIPILLSCGADALPKLAGAWFERAEKRHYRNSGGADDLRPFAKGFSVIDPGRGLIFTHRICGTLSDTEIDVLPGKPDSGDLRIEIIPPKLTFRHHMHESDGSPRYWRYRSGSSEGCIETIRRPEFQLFCREGVPDAAILADLTARAQELASAKLSVGSAVDVETGTYAGSHPLKCDGVVERVTWSADYSKSTTAYCFGPPVTIPDGGCEVCLSTPAAPAQAPAVSQPYELRLTNANKHGPVVIKSSDERRQKLASDGQRDDTEDNLFAELDDFDEDLQEPKLSNLAPAERDNWRCRNHSPSPNPQPDSQDKAWALQLISDDKYALETALNRSTEVIRLCDENRGDLDDIWRVRAIPSADDVAADMEQRDDPTRVKIISTNQAFRLMWLINSAIGLEGGWITDVPPEGLGLEARSDDKQTSPPRRIGQIGNIVILTNDDEITQTRDGDLFTYANIRHDAHFHKSEQKDGRIRFADSEPGTRPDEGTPLVGEMVCDPTLKNTDTGLGKESGQWCPQLRIPYLDGFSDDAVPSYFSQGGGAS